MRLKSSLAAVGCVLALLAPSGAVFAAPTDAYYETTLSRVADDVYRDQSSGVVVVTSGCLDLALADNAVYSDSPRQVFFSDGEQCAVDQLIQPSIRLSRVGQDLYKDTGGQGYLRTEYCYVYTYGEDVVLLPRRVVFLSSGQDCRLPL